jgi:hypothetical protein
MCKTSEKHVGKLSTCDKLNDLFCTSANSFTLRRQTFPKVSNKLCARFCTAILTPYYLFEQLLYPTSTALIIRTIS